MKNLLTVDGPKFHVEISVADAPLSEHDRVILLAASRILRRVADGPYAPSPQDQAGICTSPAGCTQEPSCSGVCQAEMGMSPQGQPEQAPHPGTAERARARAVATCGAEMGQSMQGCCPPPHAVVDSACAAETVQAGAGRFESRHKQLRGQERVAWREWELAREKLREYEGRHPA